jgi:hypothetical protein
MGRKTADLSRRQTKHRGEREQSAQYLRGARGRRRDRPQGHGDGLAGLDSRATIQMAASLDGVVARKNG